MLITGRSELDVPECTAPGDLRGGPCGLSGNRERSAALFQLWAAWALPFELCPRLGHCMLGSALPERLLEHCMLGSAVCSRLLSRCMLGSVGSLLGFTSVRNIAQVGSFFAVGPGGC